MGTFASMTMWNRLRVIPTGFGIDPRAVPSRHAGEVRRRTPWGSIHVFCLSKHRRVWSASIGIAALDRATEKQTIDRRSSRKVLREPPVRRSGPDHAAHRPGARAAGKHLLQRRRIQPEVLRQHPLATDRRSVVGARSRSSNNWPGARPGQFARTRPPATAPPSTNATVAGAVVGALGAVHPRGAAELGHHQHRGPRPGLAQRRSAAPPARRRAASAAAPAG